MKIYKNRKEVPDKYKWDLTEFYKSDDEFLENLKETDKKIQKLSNYKKFYEDPRTFKEFLDLYIDVLSEIFNESGYAYLKNDEVLGVAKNIDNVNRVTLLETKFNKAVAFFEPELLKLSKDKFDLLINDELLKDYAFMLQEIYRNKEHTLSENEEKIVTELVNSTNNYSQISSVLLNSEHNYGKIKLDDNTKEDIATTNFRRLMKNKNPLIRKKVYNSFNKRLHEYGQTSASLLSSYVNLNNSLSKIRNFDSAWDKHLFNINLTDKVYGSLVNIVEGNLTSLHNYYALKRKVLGFEKLHQYDLALNMSSNDKEYTIEDCQTILLKAVKPLGKDYVDRFEKIFKNNYVDYCQYKGKCSGGYSLATLDKNTRILMSFNGDLDSISTLAHEGGHNVHHQYIMENNSLQYRQEPRIVSEVASLTNEFLLSDYIYNNLSSKSEKLAGLENIIGVIVSNLYGAVREGKIEKEFYEYALLGNAITREYLDDITVKSLKKYYGNNVVMDKYSKNTWITRMHYYMDFYLYNYAVCVSVAAYVSSQILKGNKDMLDKYIQFLSTGSNVPPMDAYKILGVDIEKEDIYIETINYFNELVTKYEKLYFDKEV